MIFIGAFVLFKDSPFLQNKGPLSRLATISLAEGAPRFMVWDMAFQGFKERPILGWGQESFNYVFNKYYNPNMYGQEQWFDRSHNIFLDWLIAGGLLGFISYLLLYGAAIFTLWRGPGSAFFSLAEKAVLTGLFGGYLVNNIFVFDQLTSYLIFFSILAFFYSQNVFQVPAPRDARYRRFDRVLVNRIIAPIVIILLIVGLYSINIKPMRAATTLTKALQPQNGGPKENLELFKRIFSYRTFGDTEAREQLAQISYAITTATSVPIDIKQAFFDLTKSELLLQLKRTPEDARYQFFMGTFLDRFRLYADAKPFLEKALALSPRKQSMLFELGTVYLNTGGIEKALEFFKRAMELAPDYREARLIYAVGAIYARDQVLARKILEPIATTTLLPDERFVTAYAAIGDFNSVLAIRQKMVEANPNQSSARLSLAAALLKVGRREESIIQIKKAIELDPNFKAQGDEIIKQIRAGWTP
jgi:tetratricopeptide (TPR) repeat protein